MRGRLAPSPTGALHLGNARSFLLAWLDARARGGEIVLRVEDLDTPRTRPGAAAQALEDLRWLGLDWDGEPLLQSSRAPAHAAALERLRAAGRAYPCTCSRREVEAALSAPHEGETGPRYPGTCRGRWRDGEEARAAAGRPPAWRFVVEEGRAVAFEDRVAGPVRRVPSEETGDFVIARGNGEAAYQLAVVVDDAFQGVDEVLRGDDLLSSTALQRLLQEALGLPSPRWAHVPLVRGPDGRRLAKRHGDTRLASLRAEGVAAERVLGLLAWWSGLGPREPVAARDLLAVGPPLPLLPRSDPVLTPADEAWLRGA